MGCRAVGVDGARRAARARREITVGRRGACVRRGTCGESLMELMLSRGVCVCLESAMALWRCGYALCVILSSNISVFDMVTSTHAHRSANIVHPTLFRIACSPDLTRLTTFWGGNAVIVLYAKAANRRSVSSRSVRSFDGGVIDTCTLRESRAARWGLF